MHRGARTEAWRRGLVEIQDEGSQLICLGCEAAPDMLVVDLCAGAGGKTLALAAEMADRGRIVASDADRGRLSRIAPRLQRAGISIVETRLINPNREAAIGLMAEGFEILEEDYEKERFFAYVRHAYWDSPEGSPVRELMRSLIGKLEF